MSIVLLIIYYELFPIISLWKKKMHILKKVAVIIIYNYLLIKVITPPQSYTLEEWGWNDTVIEYFYIICECLKYTAPIMLQILLNCEIIFRWIRNRIQRVD